MFILDRNHRVLRREFTNSIELLLFQFRLRSIQLKENNTRVDKPDPQVASIILRKSAGLGDSGLIQC